MKGAMLMATTSDRVCPTHGDISALPHHNFCNQCGSGLVAKGLFRSAGESLIEGAALGAGLGVGLSLGDHLGDAIADGVSDLLG
jgi:hypothetical protein